MVAGVSSEVDLLDQGEQTKLVHVPEGIRPPGFPVPVVCVSDKGVVEMGNGGDVPGVTGKRTCAEIALVIDKIGDDHLDDLQGEPGGRGRACRRILRGSTTGTYSPDSGYTSVPNSHGEQLDRCGYNRLTATKRWRLEVPDSEDVGVFVDAIEVFVSGGRVCSLALPVGVWCCLDGLPITRVGKYSVRKLPLSLPP
jgi:hypothetical protein